MTSLAEVLTGCTGLRSLWMVPILALPMPQCTFTTHRGSFKSKELQPSGLSKMFWKRGESKNKKVDISNLNKTFNQMSKNLLENRKKNYTCPECKQKFKSNTKTVLCQYCKLFLHCTKQSQCLRAHKCAQRSQFPHTDIAQSERPIALSESSLLQQSLLSTDLIWPDSTWPVLTSYILTWHTLTWPWPVLV